MATDTDILEAKQAYQDYLKSFQQTQPQAQDTTQLNQTLNFVSPQGQMDSAVGQLSQPGVPQDQRDSLLAQYHKYSDPIDVTNSRTAAGNVGTMALEGAGAMVFPPIEGAEGAGVLAKGWNALMNAGEGATGMQVGRTIAEQSGMAPKSTPLQTLGNFALNTGLGLGGEAISGIRNASAASQAEKSALEDPTSQAAIRFAQNQGYLDTPTAKAALDKNEVTQEVSDAAQQAQKDAILTKTAGVDSGKDYLPGMALGYPENNSARSFAGSEEMAQAGPTIIQSGVLNGGKRINPFTGKFEGPPSTPTDNYALANKMELASSDIIAARKQTVMTLDQAANDINSYAVNLGDRVEPITFQGDVAPLTGDLQDIIQKRSLLRQTVPISDAMELAYRKVEDSFRSVYQGTSRLTNQAGDPVKVGTTEALSMIEDMNAFRKSLGEFDEVARANGLNSTHNDFAGRAAELYSLSKVQGALQQSLENKASEILSKVSGVKDPKPWMQSLAQVTDSTLPTMNKTYGAFQTAKEAAMTYGNTTMRGVVAPESKRFISQGQQQSTADLTMEAAQHPVRTAARQALNRMGLGPDPFNPALAGAQRNSSRPSAAISQMLDGLLLREKPVPIISRDWDKISQNPDMMNEVANRAYMLGIVPMGSFNQLPDPTKKLVHKTVVQAYPQGAEVLPGNMNAVNQEYLNPMDKDAVFRDNLDKSPSVRAHVFGRGFQNKIPDSISAPPSPKLPGPDLAQLNHALTFNSAATDFSYNGETKSLVDELMQKTQIHDQDVVH